MSKIENNVLRYIEDVLEVPRGEYGGLSACPFAKKERKSNNIYMDIIGEDNDFLKCMDKFYESGKDNAIFVNDVEMPSSDTKRYQHFLNKELLLNAFINHKALCINPKDDLEVDGFNPRSYSPYFLILINNQKEINQAHSKIMKTSYFDKMSKKYKKYLGV
tara:strand:+ start:332 stop:814 length:483 start_codon:yes stop_codon:yes gene_type:complete